MFFPSKSKSKKFNIEIYFVVWIFFFFLIPIIVYSKEYPSRKHWQELIKIYNQEQIPYSRNIIFSKEIPKQTSDASVKFLEFINFKQSKSWKETLQHCGNVRIRMWVEVLHFHFPTSLVKSFTEECIRITTLKLPEQLFKKLEKKILLTINKWKIIKPELAPLHLEENIDKKFQELKKEWENLAFNYSNFHSAIEPNIRKKSHYIELAKINHKINHLIENTLFNPIDSEEDKIIQINKILKDIERLKKRRITQLVRNVEISKSNVKERNKKLLFYFREIIQTWNSNPSLHPYLDKGNLVLDCFQGWDKEKINLYSLDYFINFFEDYHSYHTTIRVNYKPEEQEVLDNFHHFLYDSYLFSSRLESILKICRKISNNEG